LDIINAGSVKEDMEGWMGSFLFGSHTAVGLNFSVMTAFRQG